MKKPAPSLLLLSSPADENHLVESKRISHRHHSGASVLGEPEAATLRLSRRHLARALGHERNALPTAWLTTTPVIDLGSASLLAHDATLVSASEVLDRNVAVAVFVDTDLEVRCFRLRGVRPAVTPADAATASAASPAAPTGPAPPVTTCELIPELGGTSPPPRHLAMSQAKPPYEKSGTYTPPVPCAAPPEPCLSLLARRTSLSHAMAATLPASKQASATRLIGRPALRNRTKGLAQSMRGCMTGRYLPRPTPEQVNETTPRAIAVPARRRPP